MDKKSQCQTCKHFTYYDLYTKEGFDHSRQECKKLQVRFEENTKILNCRDYEEETTN